jgi:hypothetical protein
MYKLLTYFSLLIFPHFSFASEISTLNPHIGLIVLISGVMAFIETWGIYIYLTKRRLLQKPVNEELNIGCFHTSVLWLLNYFPVYFSFIYFLQS